MKWVVFGVRENEKDKVRTRLIRKILFWAAGAVVTDPAAGPVFINPDLEKFLDLKEKGPAKNIELAIKVSRLGIPVGEKHINDLSGSNLDWGEVWQVIWRYWLNDLHYGVVDRLLRRLRLGAALAELKFNREDTVVDMGCGRQAFLGWKIRKKVKKYTGLDKEMPEMDLENLSFKQVFLDKPVTIKFKATKILGTAIMEHLYQPEVWLASCYRGLVSGGQLAITTPAPFSDRILKLMVEAKLIKADEVFDHVHYYSLPKLAELVEKSGFKITVLKRFGFGVNNLIVAVKP